VTDTSKDTVEDIVLGIDLGTTNSLAAVLGKDGPRVLRDRDGDPIVPSVVTIMADGTFLVGKVARDRALELPERTIYSVKRLVGRAGEEVDAESKRLAYTIRQGDRGLARVVVDGKEYSPEEISAEILKKVKTTAEAALSAEIRRVVITVPAYFDDAQRQATRDAAQLAGLECLRILNEPTAASLAYGVDGSKDGHVLVYDLGGGTFDVSILKIKDGIFSVKSTSGNTHLGGDDFDNLLGERILDVLRAAGTNLETLTPYVRQAIRRSAEGLKIQLSSAEQASLEIDLGTADTQKITVARDDFEDMITPFVTETIDCCARALRDAGLTVEQMDDVVLVGGSTRVPLVRSRLAEFAGCDPHTQLDPDLAVGMGAAIQAGVLASGDRSVLLLDVVPLSLGIETMGGVISKLIMRNATIPTAVTEEFSTQVDNQTAVDINIYQGEREKIEDCRMLGAFKLRGIPPMPAGLPRIAVTFLVDADGVLKVIAKEQRTGAESSVQVVPSFGLSREEVRQMMIDSIENAEEDMAAREAIDLRNKAEAIVKGTRKALQLSDLPPDQTFSIKRAVKKLDELLEDGAETADIHEATEELSRLTAQVADDVISSAVRKSLTGDQGS
jgi:molecular chaperone DnaK (HSP70)